MHPFEWHHSTASFFLNLRFSSQGQDSPKLDFMPTTTYSYTHICPQLAVMTKLAILFLHSTNQPVGQEIPHRHCQYLQTTPFSRSRGLHITSHGQSVLLLLLFLLLMLDCLGEVTQ